MKRLVFILLCSIGALGQTAPYALMPVPRQQFFSAIGQPLAGGLIYTYIAGTSTPQATYTDSSGTIQNTNPIVLDSGGFATVWLGPSAYKVVAQNSLSQQQWAVDNVSDLGQILYTKAVLLTPVAAALQTIVGPLGANYFQQNTLHFTSPGVRVSILDPATTLDTITNPPTLAITNPLLAGQSYQVPDPGTASANFVLSPGVANWIASTLYTVGTSAATIQPAINNPCAFTFIATVGGTSGTTNPTFSTTPCGSSATTVADNGITWTSQGLNVPTNTLDCTRAGITCKRTAYFYFEGGGCNNTSAAMGWDTFGGNSPTPFCVSGNFIQKGVLGFPSAATHIQENTGMGAGATTCTTTYPAATAAGDLLEVEMAVDSSRTVSSVTDGTNAYSKAAGATNSVYDSEIWYFNGNSTSMAAGTTLTVTLSGAGNCALDWKEYNGILTAAALDKTVTNTGTGLSATTGTTTTTSNATELVLATVATNGNPIITGQNGWVQHSTVSQISNVTINSQGKIQQIVGPQSATFTLGTSSVWVGAIATFKTKTVLSPQAQRGIVLPQYYISTVPVNASIKWQVPQPPVGTVTTALGASVVCTADGSTDDPTYPIAVSAGVGIPPGAANILATTSLPGLISAGCAPNDVMHFLISRPIYATADTYEGWIYVNGAGLTFGINQ